MGIFTHEIGLSLGIVVGLVFRSVDVGIHHAVEVGGRVVGTGGAFIVDDSRIEGTGGLVGGMEVQTRVALISQTPEDDRGEVAVAKHHAHGAVNILCGPRGSESDAGGSAVFPVEMAFNVGLIHAVETIIVKHGVHLGLARIMTGAHGVDIGLFHHLDVFQHGRHVNGTAVDGVRVLRVDAFEQNGLAVDVDFIAANGNMAETIFR